MLSSGEVLARPLKRMRMEVAEFLCRKSEVVGISQIFQNMLLNAENLKKISKVLARVRFELDLS